MSKKPKLNEVVGITRLKNFYDRYVLTILGNRLTEIDTPRGKRRQFKVVESLPDKEAYCEMRDERYTTTVDSVVEGAFSACEGIKDELQEWYDNLPEPFQDGERGDRLQEAVDGFESLYKPDTPGVNDGDELDLREVPVLYLPDLDANSRPRIAGEAANKLRAVVELFQSADAKDDDDREILGDVWEENSLLLKTEIAEWVQELENQADEIEAVEIPGMFG